MVTRWEKKAHRYSLPGRFPLLLWGAAQQDAASLHHKWDLGEMWSKQALRTGQACRRRTSASRPVPGHVNVPNADSRDVGQLTGQNQATIPRNAAVDSVHVQPISRRCSSSVIFWIYSCKRSDIRFYGRHKHLFQFGSRSWAIRKLLQSVNRLIFTTCKQKGTRRTGCRVSTAGIWGKSGGFLFLVKLKYYFAQLKEGVISSHHRSGSLWGCGCAETPARRSSNY